MYSEYDNYVDFNACDGVVAIIWRGKSDIHLTAESKTCVGFTCFGTSVQIADKLVNAIKKAAARGKDENCKRFKGFHDIVKEIKKKNQ
jgi:hypothetical protein